MAIEYEQAVWEQYHRYQKAWIRGLWPDRHRSASFRSSLRSHIQRAKEVRDSLQTKGEA